MRIRTVKPEFWMHEGLCKCSEFSRLLAIALLNWSDDEGYFMANPILIRGQVFPFEEDSKKVPRALQELSSVGWITLGKDDQGRDVGFVKNFTKHQRVDKAKPSSIKGNFRFLDESGMDQGCFQDESWEEWNGMERNGSGKGKGMDSSATDETSFDPQHVAISWDLQTGFGGITEKDLSEWSAAYPAVNLQMQMARAHTWLKDNPAKRKKHVRRFLSGWFSRSQEKGGDIASTTTKPSRHAGLNTMEITGNEF